MKHKKIIVSIWANGTHPAEVGHTNLRRFDGVLAMADEVTAKAPSGACGHRITVTPDAFEQALPSLLGMAVDYKAGWDGHDARQKCGIITSAHLEKKKLSISGYLYHRDFPEIAQQIASSDMGMSYEIADVHIADMREAVWRVTRLHFTGAAILLREKAAYKSSRIAIHSAMKEVCA